MTKHYNTIHKALNHEPIPVFQSKTHVITPSTYHKDLWVWASKENPTQMFCITASYNWLLANFRLVRQNISPRELYQCKRTRKAPIQ